MECRNCCWKNTIAFVVMRWMDKEMSLLVLISNNDFRIRNALYQDRTEVGSKWCITKNLKIKTKLFRWWFSKEKSFQRSAIKEVRTGYSALLLNSIKKREKMRKRKNQNPLFIDPFASAIWHIDILVKIAKEKQIHKHFHRPPSSTVRCSQHCVCVCVSKTSKCSIDILASAY